MGRRIAALALIVLLVAAAVWWRAVWVTRHLIREDAPAAIAEKSGNVYQVAVGRVRFNPLSRRVSVDTIDVTTNATVNAARPHPRAALRLAFTECTMSGVHVFRLILRRGLEARAFGCGAVSARIDVPRGAPDSTPTPDAERAFFIMQQSLKLPASAPQVRVSTIDFPHVALDFRLAQRGGEMRLELDHLRWRMSGFLIDPRDSTVAARPFFSDAVEIAAARFRGQMSDVTAITVDTLGLSLSDSALTIRGVAFAPTSADSAAARSPWRRTMVRMAVARIDARGLDVGVFLLRQGVRARAVELDSLAMDISSDHRRPKNPRRPRRRTPQAFVADIERGIHVDSVVIKGGEIVYREQKPRHDKPGVLTFARLEAVATDVRHKSAAVPLSLRATAWLQNAGRLDAEFVVPLDAPRFTMTFRGRLGAMPVAELNRVVAEVLPLKLEEGRIERIDFQASVTNGVARGSVVPLYKDLKVAITGEGQGGILGTGGVIGDAARSVATLVGNLTGFRSDNPGEGERTPRTGAINHAFTPDQTLPGFLWKSIRGGLMAVVRK